MSPDILASIIIKFCHIKDRNELLNEKKAACVDFMTNCSVDREGQILPERVEKCKETWINSPKLEQDGK